jgi:hypothetical protein
MVEILEKIENIEFDIDELIRLQESRVKTCECYAFDDETNDERAILVILKLQKPLEIVDGCCPTCGSKNVYLYEQDVDWDYNDNMTTFVKQTESDVCLSCHQVLNARWR